MQNCIEFRLSSFTVSAYFKEDISPNPNLFTI
jgi:hypothetical protein